MPKLLPLALLVVLSVSCGSDPLAGCPPESPDDGPFTTIGREVVRSGRYLNGEPLTPQDTTKFRCQLGCSPESRSGKADAFDQSCDQP